MIRPFGEAAVLVEVRDAGWAQALAADLIARPIPGVTGAVPALETVLVELDPTVTSIGAIQSTIRQRMGGALPAPRPGRERTIPVLYGGDAGPDLAAVAVMCGRSEAEVVAEHSALELRVLFGGFAPGFAYLGDLPDALRVPRLDTPRTRTPAGSVAVAGHMTGIYPAELPGGWRVIGRTPILLFDPRREPPAYLLPGDVVRFRPMEAGEWERRPGGAPDDWG